MTFLKQQVQTDERAFDIVAKAGIDCKTSSLGRHDPTKASEADFCNFYEKVCEVPVTKRGVLSHQRIRQLLHQYYSAVHNPGEKISQFSHRLDVQHALEKLAGDGVPTTNYGRGGGGGRAIMDTPICVYNVLNVFTIRRFLWISSWSALGVVQCIGGLSSGCCIQCIKGCTIQDDLEN